MVSLSLLLASLFLLAPYKADVAPADTYKSYLNVTENERGNNTLASIKTFEGSEFRVYHYDDLVIDEIDDDAFLGTAFTSLMLTNSVTHITDTVFENSKVKYLYFTGSEEEFSSLNLTYEFTFVKYYSDDEGFINYWNKEIRPTKETNICDISKAKFNEVYSLYKGLDTEDLKVVDNYVDLDGAKIVDSMKQLVNLFAETHPSQKNDEWNQTGAITLIIFIAVLGMTSITIFFLLKTKHLID